MTCRSGVVSVAIVVRTARTTASVLTPEPNTLRARTDWSGRVLYAPLVGPGMVVRGAHDVWGVCWVHVKPGVCLRPCRPEKRCVRPPFAADRDRTVRMRIGCVCWGGAEDAHGGVGNPSMGGVNPPALVLDRNYSSG